MEKVICEIRMKLPSANEYIGVCRTNPYKAAKFKKDLEEQDARIAKLRKEAEGEDEDNEIKVVFTGRAKEYAK